MDKKDDVKTAKEDAAVAKAEAKHEEPAPAEPVPPPEFVDGEPLEPQYLLVSVTSGRLVSAVGQPVSPAVAFDQNAAENLAKAIAKGGGETITVCQAVVTFEPNRVDAEAPTVKKVHTGSKKPSQNWDMSKR